MTTFLNGLSLGLGLLSIGRTWGVVPKTIPSEADVSTLLAAALEEDVLIWDTAPAYFLSEERIGRFLKMVLNTERSRVLLMTKFGEYVTKGTTQPDAVTTFTDHSYKALMTSLDQSLLLLGSIHAIQVHKTNLANVVAGDTCKALQAAKNCGIKFVGASVSDVATGLLALESGCYDFLQFPFSLSQNNMQALLEKASTVNVPVVVNRPFAMGALVQDSGIAGGGAFEAMLFLKRHIKAGAILTGTANASHLRSNVKAFRAAVDAVVPPLGKLQSVR